MESLTTKLASILSDPQVATDTIFDILWLKVEDEFASRTYNSISDLKDKAAINKEKGTLFEDFCFLLIKKGAILSKLGIVDVYKFSELTDELRILLGITTASGKPTRKDMGIDLFAKCASGEWLAIQCKYLKKPTKQKYTPKGFPVAWVVPCGCLSSFYDICSRTGPKAGNSWLYNIVLTNCNGVRRRAKAGAKDLSICHGTFAGLKRDVWASLCEFKGNRLHETEKPSRDVLGARNAFLDRLVGSKNVDGDIK